MPTAVRLEKHRPAVIWRCIRMQGASVDAGLAESLDATVAAGGSHATDPIDDRSIHARSFDDPDGHCGEVLWTDPRAIEH